MKKDKAFAIVIIAILVVAVGVYLSIGKSKSTPDNTTAASLSSLNTSNAPWNPEYLHLSNRLKAINMPLLGTEGTALHIHSHIDLYIEGKAIAVPADIGVPPNGGITPLHTHDNTGIVHVESPDKNVKYTLKQLFDVWGVKLTDRSIGNYIENDTQKLVVYSNGTIVKDPVSLPFKAHEEIVITYGTSAQLPSINSSYNFPSGL